MVSYFKQLFQGQYHFLKFFFLISLALGNVSIQERVIMVLVRNPMPCCTFNSNQTLWCLISFCLPAMLPLPAWWKAAVAVWPTLSNKLFSKLIPKVNVYKLFGSFVLFVCSEWDSNIIFGDVAHWLRISVSRPCGSFGYTNIPNSWAHSFLTISQKRHQTKQCT